jgi:hypothetical protein
VRKRKDGNAREGTTPDLLWTIAPSIIDVRPHLGAPLDAFFCTAGKLLVTYFVADVGAFRLKIDIAIDDLLNDRAETGVYEFSAEVCHETLRPIHRRRRRPEEGGCICISLKGT